MSFRSLLNKGGPERGKLEAFADGCNAMARGLWLQRTVTVIKSGNRYSSQLNNHKSLNDKLMSKMQRLEEINKMGFGQIVAGGLAFAYLITCIFPTLLIMGVGVAAKKIAIENDERAKRYQAIVEKHLTYDEQAQELKELQKQYQSKLLELRSINKEEDEWKEIKNPIKGVIVSDGRPNKKAKEMQGQIENKIKLVKSKKAYIKKEVDFLSDEIDKNKAKETKKELDVLLEGYNKEIRI